MDQNRARPILFPVIWIAADASDSEARLTLPIKRTINRCLLVIVVRKMEEIAHEVEIRFHQDV